MHLSNYPSSYPMFTFLKFTPDFIRVSDDIWVRRDQIVSVRQGKSELLLYTDDDDEGYYAVASKYVDKVLAELGIEKREQ